MKSNFWKVVTVIAILTFTVSCKPKSDSVTKSYDAFVNQQRTAQQCWLSESGLAALAQTNPGLHRKLVAEWSQSRDVILSRLSSDSETSPESIDALRRTWLATPPSIRALFVAPESDAQIRLASASSFPARCVPPQRGTATGEAVDLQACWRVESQGSGTSAPRIILTVLNDPAVIHRVFIPVIVATTMETRLQATGQAVASMQASLAGSLKALGEATVADLEGSGKGQKLLQDFVKRFGAADKSQLSASVPFQILALAELLDAAYCSRETYERFTVSNDLPMPKSVAAIQQLAAADPEQIPWFLRK